MLNLGFLASHNGSNVQAIIDACRNGRLKASPSVVISNNSAATVLQRARREGIPTHHLSRRTHPLPEDLDTAILDVLTGNGVDLVVLAGYMRLLGHKTVSRFRGHILNTHPSLLPRYGGEGMYGLRVHEAVLAAGDVITGATIHQVDEEYDLGPILAQRKIPVLQEDTAETLQRRVLKCEHELYIETLQRISAGQIKLG